MLNNTPTPTDTQAALSGAVDASEDHNKVMNRDAPDPVASRVAAVTQWQSDVLEARTYWVRHAFDQMVADQRFVSGNQWGSNDPSKGSADAEEAGYVANFTLRHVSQQTATLYGKNPKIVARRLGRQPTDADAGAATLAVGSAVRGPQRAGSARNDRND
jgi:hypothetical protein